MLKEERIGIEFTTNESYQVIVIDYVNTTKVQVMFLDEHKWTTWTQWGVLKSGQLKNPYHKSVYGVGYLGADENGEIPKCTIHGKSLREYQLWRGMLQRCYDEKYHERQSTYENCTVCDRWKCYSYFLEDISKIKDYELWRDNPNSGISLDKDIYYSDLGMITDCKEYSLLTTRFITKSDNTKEMVDRCGTHMPTPPRKVKCIETQVIYESINEAERQTGISHGNIINVCKGKLKTTGGFHWEYVD